MQCVFFWSEEHARAHRRQTHRSRGACLKAEQMVQAARSIRSALFGFPEQAAVRR